MKKEKRTNTSAAGIEKLKRAIRQLINVHGLLRSLPNYIWITRKKELTILMDDVEKIEKKITQILDEQKPH
jgi:hypothetical protein